MEYVFGTHSVTGEELLKTKGEGHSDLSGICEVVRNYPDCTITDTFHVVRRMKASEDAEGNCYDWYIIDRHYRSIDRTGPLAEAGAKNAANIDYLSMMTGVELPGDD